MNKDDFEKLKSASLAHQLIKSGRLINEQGLAAARTLLRMPELKQTHLDLFPYIDFSGSRVSDIAKRKGVSKQAVSKLVQEMVEMKLLTLKSDPQDSRSKLVLFKTTGPLAIQNGFAALLSIDRQLTEQLGEKSYQAALTAVSAVMKILEGEAQT